MRSEECMILHSFIIFHSLEYKKTTANAWASVTELANIGAAYQKLGEYTLALDYNQQGIQQSLQSPNRPVLDHLYANRGEVFMSMHIADSAEHYANAAYTIAKDKNQPYHILPILKLLGEVHQEKGNAELAVRYFEEGYALASEIENRDFQASMGCELGKHYIAERQFAKAVQILKEVYRQAEELQNFVHLECASAQLANVYEWTKNYALAVQFLKKHQMYRDSMAGLEKSKHVMELERQYRTEMQGRELAEKDLALSRQSAHIRNLIIGALAVLLMLLGVLQYLRYRIQLRRAEAENLKELDSLKSTFFANVSHEFRTPLSLILGPVNQSLEAIPASEVLDDDIEVPVKGKYLAVIKRNALRLQNLVNQLLDLSKLDRGKMRLQVADGKIIQFIRSIVFSFESLAERKHIHFHTQFPPEIEGAYFDRDKLEKILVNLLSNAFKFTPEHGSIHVQAEDSSRGLRISIIDSGQGIDNAAVEKIFNRFYQVEGTEAQGTGIGLSLVKELVELHRGQIRVDSTIGKGTTFKVYIPYRHNDFKNDEIIAVVPGVTSSKWEHELLLPIEEDVSRPTYPAVSDKPLALIVEDNADLRIYIREQLQDNYQIITANNGREGCDIALVKIPDIIISDVMMPQMNGIELCEAVKTDNKTSHIPVILLTAKAAQHNKIEGLESGADDYLTKPFSARELRTRIHNLIEQRRLLREKFQGELLIQPTKVQLNSLDQQFIQQVMQNIELNMSNEFYAVEDLASAVGFSRSQLNRKLKAIGNTSANQLIRDFRMRRAKDLLEQNAGTVSEIAYQVGYSNLSYFSKSFKQAFGMVPSEA